MGFRVLVVDDAISARGLIRTILQRAGMEIVGEAGTGAEAVQKYKELWPDLVTMDLVMPHMSGTEAAAEIMKVDVNARIIAVSGLTQPSVMAEAEANGIVAFVHKPLDPAELVAEIESVMSKPAF